MSEAGATASRGAEFTAAYETLRGLAESYLRRFPDAVTLPATAVVHEAYLKLAQDARQYADQAHFIRTAAMAMRQILVDYARARQSAKRGGGEATITVENLDLAAKGQQANGVDVLILNDALQRLEGWDRQQAQVVELRCFMGLSVEETARNLEISEATVKRDWAMARAWLRRELATQ